VHYGSHFGQSTCALKSQAVAESAYADGVTNMEERWLSVDDVAAYLGIRRDTIYKWIDRKKMPAHKVGRLWKFRRADIDKRVVSGMADESQPETSPAEE